MKQILRSKTRSHSIKQVYTLLVLMSFFAVWRSAVAQDVSGYGYTNYTSINEGTWTYGAGSNPFTVTYSGGAWNTRARVSFTPVALPTGLSNYVRPSTMLELGAVVGSTPPSALYTFESVLPANTVLFIQDVDALESFQIQFLDASGTVLNPGSLGTFNSSNPVRSTATFSTTGITVTAVDDVNHPESLNTFVISSALIKQVRVTQIASRSVLANSGTAEFYFAAPPVPLPVSLVSFTAKAQTNQTVLLEWTTSWERNNKGYTLERSKDLIFFEPVGQVRDVAGTSSSINRYRFVDSAPFSGTSYYRLTQVDLDGTTKVFPAVSVVLRTEAYGIFPNPIRDGQFTLNLDEPLMATVNLYAADGRQVGLQKSGHTDSSLQLKTTQSLTAGLYVLMVTERGQTRQYRIIIN